MQEIIDKLDPDTRKRFEEGEIGIEDLKGLGLIPEDFNVEGESYEHEGYGSEEGEEEKGEEEEGGTKRLKDDEDE